MAGRKPRGNISQRDLEFIRIAQAAKEKAQTAYPAPKPIAAEKVPAPQEQPAPGPVPPASEADRVEKTVAAPQRQPAPAPVPPVQGAAPSKPEPTKSAAATSAKPKRSSAAPSVQAPAQARGRDGVSVRVWVRIPDALMARAAKWAEESGVPTTKIVTKAFGEYKPRLVAEIEAGLARDGVDFSRGDGGRQSYDTRVRLDRDLYDRLRARHDPNDLVGLNVIVSRWARDRFAEFFDEWLKSHNK